MDSRFSSSPVTALHPEKSHAQVKYTIVIVIFISGKKELFS